MDVLRIWKLMPYHLSNESELFDLLACKPTEQIDALPRGDGRNQSKQHTELVNSCLQLLQMHGIFAWKNHVGAVRMGKRFLRFGVPGLPDILFVRQSRLGGIEVKTGAGRQSRAQQVMQDRFEAQGCTYWVVRSIDELDSLLKATK
jgi:hypothetical protein